MEEKKNDALDAFIERLVKDGGLEEPSADFTTAVISKIEKAEEGKAAFAYRPLISKKTWAFVFACVILLFLYTFLEKQNLGESWVSNLNLNKLANFNLFGNLANFSAPNTFVYGLFALMVFIWVQIVWLAKRTTKTYRLG